jgi:DNA-binding CsgD family transcriptional regulator
MKYRLMSLYAINKLDTCFLAIAEAQELTDYFSTHGTSNEQMLSNYLLGRTYADNHEAPKALHYYHLAAERADTMSPDCDYRLLSRVYGQMGTIFYNQNLMEQSIACDDKSIEYAWRGKDTLNALLSMAGNIVAYKKLQKTDEAIRTFNQVSTLLRQNGYESLAAAVAFPIIRDLIDNGNIKAAKKYLYDYETKSGYFDSNHNIEKGREVYYYTKGYYYLSIGELDSAEFFFRKELYTGKDFNNQNAGAIGLARLFQKKNMPDSAAKYALYGYAMNDSAHTQKATKEVEQTQAMYDYTHNQEIAQQERDKRASAEQKSKTMEILCIILCVIAAITLYYFKRKRKAEHALYNNSISKLAIAQNELNMLRSHTETYERLLNKTQAANYLLRSHEQDLIQIIKAKEKEVIKLNEDVESYKEKIHLKNVNAEAKLEEENAYQNLKKKAAKAKTVSDEEWQEIIAMVIKIQPNYYRFISSNKYKLNDKEFKTCLLIRLLFIPKEISSLLGLSQPSITKIRNNLMKKLFGQDGNSKELDKKLKEFL